MIIFKIDIMVPQYQLPKLVGGTKNEQGRQISSMFPMAYQSSCDYISDDEISDDELFQINHQSFAIKEKACLSADKSEKMDEEKNQKNILQAFFERATKEDEGQHVMLADLEQTGKKILYDNKELFPAFTLITNEDKGKINAKRYILRSMLNPYNRQKAKAKFVELASFVSKQTGFQEPLLNDFEEENSQKEKCFQWYSKECFYYKLINKGLRAFKSPEEYYYLRLIFSDLFTTILHKYQSEEHDEFICWRRSFLKETDVKKLKQNIGHFIELQGFISTTKNFKKLQKFRGDILFEFQVPKKKLCNCTDNIDYGYTDISGQSTYKKQFEVLFNAINYFKVINIEEERKKSQYKYKATLEYCRISQIMKKEVKKRTPIENELIQNHIYQENKAVRIWNQGDCFFECGLYQNCLKWYKFKLSQMDQLFKNQNALSENQKRELYRKLLSTLFLRTCCFNNMGNYEEAQNQITKCEKVYEKIKQRDSNSLFISKAKGSIKLNCGKIKEGINILKQVVKQIKIEKKGQEWQKSSIQWDRKEEKNYFRDEIATILQFWLDSEGIKLEEETEKLLKQIQRVRGKKNVFYLTSLRNKFITLYEKDKWKEIIAQFKKFKEEKKVLNFYTIKSMFFINYIVCLSYLQLELVKEAEKILKEFVQDIAKQNENNVKITCTEVSMFLHLVVTFVQKTYSQKYFDYLTELVKYEFCYAEKKEQLTDFQFRKENLMPFLFEKPKLMEALQGFYVEISEEEL